MYADGAVVYVLVAPVDADAAELELFLLAGDSEPRGSSSRLISTIGEVGQLLASPCVNEGILGYPAHDDRKRSRNREGRDQVKLGFTGQAGSCS